MPRMSSIRPPGLLFLPQSGIMTLAELGACFLLLCKQHAHDQVSFSICCKRPVCFSPMYNQMWAVTELTQAISMAMSALLCRDSLDFLNTNLVLKQSFLCFAARCLWCIGVSSDSFSSIEQLLRRQSRRTRCRARLRRVYSIALHWRLLWLYIRRFEALSILWLHIRRLEAPPIHCVTIKVNVRIVV